MNAGITRHKVFYKTDSDYYVLNTAVKTLNFHSNSVKQVVGTIATPLHKWKSMPGFDPQH